MIGNAFSGWSNRAQDWLLSASGMEPDDPEAPGRGKLPHFEIIPAVPARRLSDPSSSEEEVQVLAVLISRLKDYLSVRRKARSSSYYVTTLRVAKASRALARIVGKVYTGKVGDMPEYHPVLTASSAINLCGVTRTQDIISAAELILVRIKRQSCCRNISGSRVLGRQGALWGRRSSLQIHLKG